MEGFAGRDPEDVKPDISGSSGNDMSLAELGACQSLHPKMNCPSHMRKNNFHTR